MRVFEAFARQLRSTRDRRGFTLRQLSDRIGELNDGDVVGLDHARLHKLEQPGSQRRVTIDQWLLIAAALDVPPLLLILPLGDTDHLDVAASSQIHPHRALKWIRGEEPLATTQRTPIRLRDWHRMRQPIELYERLASRQDEIRADQPHDPMPNDRARPTYQKLAEVLVDMAASDVQPPAFAPWTVGRLAEFGHHPDALGVRIFTPDDWYEAEGPPVMMRHPALPGPVGIPAEATEYYAVGGWQEVAG